MSVNGSPSFAGHLLEGAFAEGQYMQAEPTQMNEEKEEKRTRDLARRRKNRGGGLGLPLVGNRGGALGVTVSR